MTKSPFIFLSILFLSLFLYPSSAEIKSLSIISDSRPMILFEKFGFTHTGHVTIFVSFFSPHSGTDPSQLDFFLLSEESLLQVLLEIQQNPQFCVLKSHYIFLLFTFRDLSPPPNSFNCSYPVSSPNEYSLFFANCVPESTVSMAVRQSSFVAAMANFLTCDVYDIDVSKVSKDSDLKILIGF
ncbi:hypothetical protein SO802_004119 [Lithocarpus litseifolius]|uniref:CAND6/7 N-terminal domain-containing protein n=1 Tax=Lithocarpus litseifolius TaxID=425828 RepID=A0AAW2E5Z6_9ROSI